jgi:hypothetical protein
LSTDEIHTVEQLKAWLLQRVEEEPDNTGYRTTLFRLEWILAEPESMHNAASYKSNFPEKMEREIREMQERRKLMTKDSERDLIWAVINDKKLEKLRTQGHLTAQDLGVSLMSH